MPLEARRRHESLCARGILFVCLFVFILFWGFVFSRQNFSVALEPDLELVLVDQAGFELTDLSASASRVLGLKV